MSSENKTPNIGLNQWQGNEYIKRNDFVNDNLIIDSKIKDLQDEKVDKVSGKELSTNDYTNEEKNKLSSLEEEIKAPAYTPTIHNCSNIFSAGEGYANDGSVLDYSESVANGQVSVGLKGLTLVNLVKNSDATTSFISDNTGTRIGIQPNGTWFLDNNYHEDTNQTFNITQGDKIFLYTRLQASSVSRIIAQELIYSDATRQTTSKSLSAVEYADVIIAIKSLKANFKVVEGDVGLIERSYQVLINMTQLGIENYTEEQMLSLVTNGYFEGAKSTVLAQRIKSTGKNLEDFKNNSILNTRNETDPDDIFLTHDSDLGLCWHIRTRVFDIIKNIFQPNKQYTLKYKVKSNGNFRLRIVHTDGSIVDGFTGSDLQPREVTLTSNINKTVERIQTYYSTDGYGLVSCDYFMLSQGTVVTPYEPYKEDKAYISCTDDDGNIEVLRSLSNGVKDEVKDGKLYRRTNEVILDGKLNYSFRENKTGFKIIKFEISQLPNHNFISRKLDDENKMILFTKNKKIYGYYQEGLSFWESDIYSFIPRHLSISISNTDSGWEENYTPSETDIKNYFAYNQYTLIYQLAEPKIIPIKGITPLQIWKNGTISIEPYLRKSIKYTSGKLTFPIALSSIDKIVDINSNEINLNNILLASDGTYATITGASDNDIFIVYASIKPGLSTVPTTVMSFPMNTKAQIESNCKGVQQLGNNVITLQDTMAMFIVKNA